MLEWLRRDWPLKVVAMVLAFGIWVSITGQGRTLKDFSVPLEIDFGDARIATAPPPTTVTVRLEGTRSTIRKLDQDQLALAMRLDLQDAPTGEREVQLTERHLDGVPRGVEVSFIEPDRLRLVVDRRARRMLEVIPELVGKPADGRFLYQTQVTPDAVLAEGPQSALDRIRELRTEPIPLDDRTESFVTTAIAVPQDSQVSVLTADPLEVRLLIGETPVLVAFDEVPILPGAEGRGAIVSPATARLTLSGPPDLVRQLTRRHLFAVAEPEGARGSGTHRATVRGDLRNLPAAHRGLIRVESVDPTHASIRMPETEEGGS